MARISPHYIETKSKDCVRNRINEFGDKGDYLFRELSERDYGIDGLIECFEDGNPTGKIGLLQIKETDSLISPLKTSNVISCGVSISNLFYVKQKRIPIIILYISLKEECPMYYADLRIISKDFVYKVDAKHVTIHIPYDNCIYDDITPLINIINSYYL